jgi:hypothetical protein
VREYKRAYERYKRAVRERGHPYWYETEHLQYPIRMFEVAPPVPPVAGIEGENEVGEGGGERQEVVFVDTEEALEEMVAELKGTGEMAVDLEYHATRSYYGFTCLMQISSRERDWVVDTLRLREAIRRDKLGGVLADPGIVKVSADAGAGGSATASDRELLRESLERVAGGYWITEGRAVEEMKRNGATEGEGRGARGARLRER